MLFSGGNRRSQLDLFFSVYVRSIFLLRKETLFIGFLKERFHIWIRTIRGKDATSYIFGIFHIDILTTIIYCSTTVPRRDETCSIMIRSDFQLYLPQVLHNVLHVYLVQRQLCLRGSDNYAGIILTLWERASFISRKSCVLSGSYVSLRS